MSTLLCQKKIIYPSIYIYLTKAREYKSSLNNNNDNRSPLPRQRITITGIVFRALIDVDSTLSVRGHLLKGRNRWNIVRFVLPFSSIKWGIAIIHYGVFVEDHLLTHLLTY